MLGSVVCYHHGGAAPATKAAARRRLAMNEAIQALGVPREIDPAEALLEAVYLSAGDVEFLRTQLPQQFATFAMGKDFDGEARITSFGDGIDVRVKLYHEALERMAKMSKLAIEAGIAERQVRIKEVQAAAIVAVFVKVFDSPSLQLSGQQRAIARQLARQYLIAQVPVFDDAAGLPLDDRDALSPADLGAHQGDA